MPIALERSGGNRIEGTGFIHGVSCVAIYDKSENPHREVFTVPISKERKEREENLDDSTSSSSIGKNSDLSSDGDDDSGDAEVQSSFNGGPLDSVDALEDVLPIKRGISKFYCGKSKSFASLADAASSSIKDLAKPENAYNKKRKNLIASRNYWEKNPLRSSGGGISKRLATTYRSTLSLAVSMGCAESNNSEGSNSSSVSPPRGFPPRHPHARRSPNSGSSSPSPQPSAQWNFSPCRSFSLSDLQGAANASPTMTGLTSKERDKEK
ncbi:hypothetical protein RJ641_025846 [Dillenia turbinata]|uniref:Uncharacterized protein n=1 Tax=Dillenia turbinata TaxID=194707 RepID=A0AAN8ZKF9_9MAGN